MALLRSTRLYAGELTNVSDQASRLVSQSVACSEVLIQNDSDNTADMFIGTQTIQPIRIVPGSEIVVPVADAWLVYLRAATSGTLARVGWLARS